MSISQQTYQGIAGPIEALVDSPAGQSPVGIAVITHPHPLQGGTARHKVPQALARCFQQHGWLAVRPNFRGIGESAGEHDSGAGETEDILQVVDTLRRQYPGIPLALAGFSFGAFVQARVANELLRAGKAPDFTILAGMPNGTVEGERVYETPTAPKDALIIHGGDDQIVPLANVMLWAKPQHLPVVVFPGANHFLTGYLDTLTNLVGKHIAA
ncbi:MAG: GntR family transcriptional regulator [Paraburkholderia sp.]|nr:alpha/beta fold hydrolase [Paraburkholderia sp.]TAM00410.1 MAG: GntR family transcriptional regulator [Paraburkholderia sp.]TAM31315.1 MAG: GntR family transcriptional regulator [Paraburkholderia sp.]